MDTRGRQELMRSLSNGLRATNTGKVFQGKIPGNSN